MKMHEHARCPVSLDGYHAIFKSQLSSEAMLKISSQYLRYMRGRAIAQAVSRRFPTAASRVQIRVWSCGMDKSGAGAGFLRELRFPLPIYITSASPLSSSLSPEAGTIGQKWPQCQ
jgi:hypothetical protein